MMKTLTRFSRGFSLVELMVALVAGLIVTGAALTFTLSSLRANTEFVGSARLTQELRNSLNFIADDLRRAGYDEDAMNYVSRPSTFSDTSPFALISISGSNDCVVYSYDRLPGTAGDLELGNGEMRAVRRAIRTVNGRDVGVLEFAESAAGVTPRCNGNAPDYSTYPASCNTGSGWCALSDPRVLDIQSFVVQNDLPDTGGGPGVIPGTASVLPLQIRRLNIDIRGSLIGATNVVRGVHERIRVRSDCVRSNAGVQCVADPVGT
jgi:prepilin-type N-terminal cleavage/methylation domain-containing protein